MGSEASSFRDDWYDVYTRFKNPEISLSFDLTEKYTKYMIGCICIGILLLAGFLQLESIVPILCTLLFSFLFREYCQQKIGGMTGDTLGAGYEVAQIVFLLSMTIQGGIV